MLKLFRRKRRAQSALLLSLLTSQTLAFLPARRHKLNVVSVAPSLPPSVSQYRAILRDRRDEDETASSNNVVTEAIDRAVSLVSKPTPGLPNLALGFPIVLLLESILVPLTQVVISAILFAALRTSARRLILFEETSNIDVYGIAAKEDDNDEDDEEAILNIQIDAVTLILAIFSAGLLTPNTTDGGDGLLNLPNVVVALALLGLSAILFGSGVSEVEDTEQLSEDDKLLNRWDQRFRKQQKSKANKTVNDKAADED